MKQVLAMETGFYSYLGQGLANESLQALFGPVFVFVNKVLLEYATHTHFHIVYGCLLTVRAELNSCDKRSHGLQSLKQYLAIS